MGPASITQVPPRSSITCSTCLVVEQVITDRNSLPPASVNLIDHAAKFVGAGMGQMCVSGTSEDDRSVIEVRDNGIGLARSLCDRRIEFFRRVGKSCGDVGQAGRGSGSAWIGA